MARGDPPTLLQQQHRAFMAKALVNAPGKTQQDKMRWAAAAWRRQKGKKIKKTKGKGLLSDAIAKGKAAVGNNIYVKPRTMVVKPSDIAKMKTINLGLKGGKVKKKGKGIGSALLKAVPYILKAAKIGAQIGSKIAAPHNQQASDILGAIGGLGVKKRRMKY